MWFALVVRLVKGTRKNRGRKIMGVRGYGYKGKEMIEKIFTREWKKEIRGKRGKLVNR